jgi:hypothetical protein
MEEVQKIKQRYLISLAESDLYPHSQPQINSPGLA